MATPISKTFWLQKFKKNLIKDDNKFMFLVTIGIAFLILKLVLVPLIFDSSNAVLGETLTPPPLKR
jgi:hypothetical protein